MSAMFLNATKPHFLDDDAENQETPHEQHAEAWIEGVAILICVVVVVMVTAGNDYSKERQFRSRNL